MPDSLPQVMTIEETAVYLRVPLSSLYKLAQDGKVPCQKVGRHWRFRKETLDCWLGQKSVSDPTPPSHNQY
ncbi:MAG: helix-turn-helix domain-containing protein [Bellilinea sp.]